MTTNLVAILWPMIALVGWTGSIWLLMYIRRLSEMHLKKIKPQELATVEQAASRLTNVTAAENFSNLLETPMLFYLLCLAVYVTQQVNELLVIMAWLYVGLRIVHSIIHVTSNHVVTRWLAYVSSTICLFGMWLLFTAALVAQ